MSELPNLNLNSTLCSGALAESGHLSPVSGRDWPPSVALANKALIRHLEFRTPAPHLQEWSCTCESLMSHLLDSTGSEGWREGPAVSGLLKERPHYKMRARRRLHESIGGCH